MSSKQVYRQKKFRRVKKSWLSILIGNSLNFVFAFSSASIAVFLLAFHSDTDLKSYSSMIKLNMLDVYEETISKKDVLEKDVAPVALMNVFLPSEYTNNSALDVNALKFFISSDISGALVQKLQFHVGGVSSYKVVKSMQLYGDGVFLAETAVMDEVVTFENLRVKIMEGGNEFLLKIRLGDGASAGDKIRISLRDIDDILVQDSSGKRVLVDANFPVSGNLITVLGAKLGF
jgi:hypothetical protein